MTSNSRGRVWRRWLWGAAAILTMTAAATTGVAQQRGGAAASNSAVERGRYLVSITGCHDCHSPKVKGTMTPDPNLLLAGRPATTPIPSKADGEIHTSLDLTAWWGPWGQSVASNLTPDPSGLGNRYTEASFVQTMRTGKKPNGTMVQPPMPVEVYQQMTEDDLKAIWAYLRTIKPVRNAVLTGIQPPAKK